MHEFVRPQDPTAGLSIVSAVGRKREESRYLFTALNTLDPDHILEREWITQWNAGGGEEIETNCFRRTLHGYLPRATLTPLEVWTKSFPVQFLSEGAEDSLVKLENSTSPESLDIQAKPRSIVSSLAQPNQHVKFFPGDEIATVLRNSSVRGVVEVQELQNQDWYNEKGEPGVAQVLNNDFFPSRPIQLSKLEEMIEKGMTRSDLHRSVGQRMKISCQVSRRLAETKLAEKHVLLRSTNTQNFPYTYSGVERSFLAQLEMQAQDVANSDATLRIMDRLANQNQGSVTPEMVTQIAAAVAAEFAKAVNKGKKKSDDSE